MREIMNEVITVSKEFGLKISDADILDATVRIYNTRKMNKFKEEVNTAKKQVQKPSSKQIETMTKFKIPYTENTTKQEAIGLIDAKFEAIKSKNTNTSDY